jgi:hypothetical protein
MKRIMQLALTLCLFQLSALAETNAHIEVKLFKTWVIKGECNFGNFAIKNTGTVPILLAKDPVDFGSGQLYTRSFPVRDVERTGSIYEEDYQMILMFDGDEKLFSLFPKETHVYEGRKFLLPQRSPFSEEMRYIVSIYLGKGFWLDSEPLTVNGVVADFEEDLATVTHNKFAREGREGLYPKKLVAITYKSERWLYSKPLPIPHLQGTGGAYYPVCPLSLKSKIRVESHNDETLFKIWDGDKFMIYDFSKSVVVEGPDENNVLGKWTRERKQKAETDNAEVRRKKAEETK